MTTQSGPLVLPGYIVEYLEALEASVHAGGDPAARQGYGFSITRAQKYYKVHMTMNGQDKSVHAFIEIATGDLIKSATWRAPQRNADKSLAVRFHLQDVHERLELCAMLRKDPGAFTGGYLYKS